MLVNAALDLVLLPSIGVVGGAIATDAAFALFVAGHLWICKNALDLPVRPLARSAVRSLAAVAAMAAVLAAFGTSSLSALEWVAGSLAAVAAYVAVLRLLGELPPGEVALARSIVAARKHRARSGGAG